MTYKEWMGEVENYSTRQERMMEDINSGDVSAIIKWVMAAYEVGYEEGHYDGYEEGTMRLTDNTHLT